MAVSNNNSITITAPQPISVTVTEKGIKGDKGDTGETGATGEAGAAGAQGIQGIQGIQGAPGNDGADGASPTASNVAATGAVMKTATSTSDFDFVIDENNFSSNLDTKVPTQQSTKAYVDAETSARVLNDGINTSATTAVNNQLGALRDKLGASADGNALSDIGTPASDDKVLIQDTSDSNNLKYVDFSAFGTGSGTGDITGVTITTDSGGGSKAEETSGSADFSILGSNGVGVTNSGTTITAVAVPGEIDHDSLNNFVAAEHVDWAGSSAGTIHSTNIPTLNQNTTGSAATLTTPRAINGVNFDGSAPITVTAAGSTLSDTVPVSKGGTNATSFADKSVIITQDSGTDTLAAVAMSTNGQVLIGGTSGPAVSTLTAGNNITITNSDGGITIAANVSSGTVTAVTGTAPIVSSGGNTPAISISAATTSAAGSMSGADKTKLDDITTNYATNALNTGQNILMTATISVADDKIVDVMGDALAARDNANSKKLIGFHTGSNEVVLQGMVDAGGAISGSAAGAPLWLGASGTFSATAPTTANEYSRVVGYYIGAIGSAYAVYFDPSKDWVQIDS